MRAKLLILGAGVFVWVALVIVVFWAGNRTKALVAKADGLRVGDAALRTRLVQAQQGLAAAESAVLARSAGLEEALSDSDSEFERIKALVRERRDNDPKFQLRYVETQVDPLIKTFLPFFRERKLSAEQIGRIRAAWINSRLASTDIAAVQKQQNLSSKDPAIRAQQAQAVDEANAIERAVLGIEGVERMEIWRRSLAVRSAVEHFAGRTSLLGETLSFDQAEELVAILAESDPGFRKRGRVDYGQVNWEVAAKAARLVLTEKQHALFAAIVADNSAQDAYQRELAVARRIKADAGRGRQ